MVLHDDVLHDSRIWREARSLNAQGWRVLVVCIALGTTRLPDVQQMDGFTIWRVSPGLFRNREVVRTTGKLIQMALALPVVFRLIRRAQARVYHAHDFTGLVMTALAGIWRRPVVYDSHELFFDRTFRGLPRWIVNLLLLLRPLEKWLAHRSVAFIATSESHAVDRTSPSEAHGHIVCICLPGPPFGHALRCQGVGRRGPAGDRVRAQHARARAPLAARRRHAAAAVAVARTCRGGAEPHVCYRRRVIDNTEH